SLKDRADICESTRLSVTENNDSSGLAEEKEEDGGQRRPEKRKEALGKHGPSTLPFGEEGMVSRLFDVTPTTFRPSYREAYRRPFPEAFLQDRLGRGPTSFHPSTRRHRRP